MSMVSRQGYGLKRGVITNTPIATKPEISTGQTPPKPQGDEMNAPATNLETITPQSETLLAIIERASKDPSVDVDKLERLGALYERAQAKHAEADFTEALTKVQAQISRILPNKTNKQTSSKYASYPFLDKIIRPLYIAQGFSLSFDTGEAGADVLLVLCHVSHTSGHTRTYKAPIPADGKGAKGGEVMTRTHATGSAMTYGMRYLLKLIFNLPIGDDDDGNAASPMDDAHVADPIYDKIGLSETVPELHKVKPLIQDTKGLNPGTRRNLIASYNKRFKELTGAAQ